MRLSPIFDVVEDWLVTFLHLYPLIGPVFLLIIEEAGIPLPIPGDIYISYVGYQISQGTIPFLSAFLLLTTAVLIGSSILYYLSFHYGKAIVLRFGKYIHLNERKLYFLEAKFRQYGPFVIIIGRHIPGFRIPVTVFAGISKVKYRTFFLSELVSIILWIGLFLEIGVKLGKKTLSLFHNHNSFFLLLIIPITLTIVTFLFGKFIPEKSDD